MNVQEINIQMSLKSVKRFFSIYTCPKDNRLNARLTLGIGQAQKAQHVYGIYCCRFGKVGKAIHNRNRQLTALSSLFFCFIIFVHIRQCWVLFYTA